MKVSPRSTAPQPSRTARNQMRRCRLIVSRTRPRRSLPGREDDGRAGRCRRATDRLPRPGPTGSLTDRVAISTRTPGVWTQEHWRRSSATELAETFQAHSRWRNADTQSTIGGSQRARGRRASPSGTTVVRDSAATIAQHGLAAIPLMNAFSSPGGPASRRCQSKLRRRHTRSSSGKRPRQKDRSLRCVAIRHNPCEHRIALGQRNRSRPTRRM
jgi:hypothetical protein